MTENDRLELEAIANQLAYRMEIFGKDYNRNGDESRESLLTRAVILLAQGTEARRAETENTGSVHDGPMAKPCAQNMSGPSHE